VRTAYNTPRKVIFQIPASLEGLSKYKQDLGIIGSDSTPGIYRRWHDENYGVSLNHPPVFNAEGNLELLIKKSNYTRLREYPGGDPGFLQWFNNRKSSFRAVKSYREGFRIDVYDYRAPLRFLFEALREYQASSTFGTYQPIVVYDAVGFKYSQYIDASQEIERRGVITEIETLDDGDGIEDGSIFNTCGEDFGDTLFGSPFSVSFMELALSGIH